MRQLVFWLLSFLAVCDDDEGSQNDVLDSSRSRGLPDLVTALSSDDTDNSSTSSEDSDSDDSSDGGAQGELDLLQSTSEDSSGVVHRCASPNHIADRGMVNGKI